MGEKIDTNGSPILGRASTSNNMSTSCSTTTITTLFSYSPNVGVVQK